MRAPCFLLLAGLAACEPEPVPAPPQGDAPTSAADRRSEASSPSERPRGGPGCIRSGSTREEVRAVMGEPDSVSFGVWIYGRSSVTFGYGTVLDLEDEGGDLIVC